MVRGRVVAIEGASAAGKTTAARRAGRLLEAVVLPEVWERLSPRPSLRYANEAELERLETRLLAAEADRWEEAIRRAAEAPLVLLDTAPFGPVTYTYGLVREGVMPFKPLREVTRRALRLVRTHRLGAPDVTVYLDVSAQELGRRAREDAGSHPPRLFERHRRVARWERRLLLGPWRKSLFVRPVRVPPGRSEMQVAERVASIARSGSGGPRPSVRAVLRSLALTETLAG